MAHVAACHLKENDHVHIAGQLGATSVTGEIGTQSKVQVTPLDELRNMLY